MTEPDERTIPAVQRFRRPLGLLTAVILLTGCTTGIVGSPTPAAPRSTDTSSTTPGSTPTRTTAATGEPSLTAVPPRPGVSDSGTTAPTTPTTSVDTGSPLLNSAADGTLVVGVKFDQPGLGERLPDGTLAGFDIEVATYLADQLGVPAAGIEFVEARSADREMVLSNGDVDYIVATYSMTDPRKEVVDFAGPYFVAGQDLLVRSDNSDITGVETLAGKVLCSVTGSTSALRVQQQHNPDVQLNELGSNADCLEALRNGAVDVVTADNLILAGLAAPFPGEFRIVGNPFSTENYGVGLTKGDGLGTAALTAALDEMMTSGAWTAALESTVGPSGFTIPEPPVIGG